MSAVNTDMRFVVIDAMRTATMANARMVGVGYLSWAALGDGGFGRPRDYLDGTPAASHHALVRYRPHR